MLTSLHIKNLALVEELQVEFKTGFNVLTGETGAGKSILIGALQLLLGDRADKNAIRSGASQCSLQAVFQLNLSHAIDSLLEEHGLMPTEDGELILRRVIKTKGKGGSWVNDQPIGLPLLKKLGDLLIDFHGPYDHQALLKPEEQLRLLDAFGNYPDEKKRMKEVYQQWHTLKKEKEELLQEAGASPEEIELFQYRFNELSEAELKPDEENELHSEYDILSKSDELRADAETLTYGLYDADESVASTLAKLRPALVRLAKNLPDASSWLDEFESLQTEVKEMALSIRDEVEGIEADPYRLQALESRLTLLERLQRKYQRDIPGLMALMEETQKKLDAIEHAEDRKIALETAMKKQWSLVQQQAASLSKKRKKAATQLSHTISQQLKELGFEKGELDITLHETTCTSTGMDHVEYQFSPNPGEPARPLRSIASSGEIARVMLAIKTSLSEHDAVPVLIFDEIDANVGGEIGVAIGRKMRETAVYRQLLSITHLPQAAVAGQHHLSVYKTTEEGRTLTRVKALKGEEREVEIARMLGGAISASTTLQHAREMLKPYS